MSRSGIWIKRHTFFILVFGGVELSESEMQCAQLAVQSHVATIGGDCRSQLLHRFLGSALLFECRRETRTDIRPRRVKTKRGGEVVDGEVQLLLICEQSSEREMHVWALPFPQGLLQV